MRSKEHGTVPAYFSRQSRDVNWHLKFPFAGQPCTVGSSVQMPECSITLLPHGILSFLPGLLEGKQATSPSTPHSASYHWPEISYWGTCIQLYKPITNVWPLTAHRGLLRYHPSSCSFRLALYLWAHQSDFASPNELFQLSVPFKEFRLWAARLLF